MKDQDSVTQDITWQGDADTDADDDDDADKYR